MRILLFGSGAREHALALKMLQSKKLEKLYLAQTGAFSNLGELIEFDDFYDLAKKAKDYKVDLLVVGPELPLAQGICDVFLDFGIKVIGANSNWARLEAQKDFAKDFMKTFGIKTSPYEVVKSHQELDFAIRKFENPPVIKACGLAAGKGVFIPKTLDEAKKVSLEFLEGKFGKASEKIILEKRLYGRELSVFSLWDGVELKSFKPACDFKKLLDNDLGPNTGGMGACFPCALTQKQKRELDLYLSKLKNALVMSNAEFTGVIYSGLMFCEDDLYVLEYNMRFGDPEIQAVLENLENDLVEIFDKMTKKELKEVDLKFKDTPSYCLVLAQNGYPYSPCTGQEIKNIDSAEEKYGVKVLFAGVKKDDKSFFSSSGRVLNIVKSGRGALDDIYKAAEEIDFLGKIYRKDINLR